VDSTAPTNNNQLSNGAGYITNYTETDPMFTASQASRISENDITNLSNLSGTNTGDQMLNVRAFGALGDGSTDDSTAIASAITTAASMATGGVVYFPAGTYVHTGITINSSNVTLAGSGRSQTVLKLTNGSNTDSISISGVGTVNVTIQDLMIDGNKGNQTGTSHGIIIMTPYDTTDATHLLQRIEVFEPLSNGVDIEGDTRACSCFMLLVRYAEGSAYHLAGSDHQMSNCIANASVKSGFQIYAPNCNFALSKAFYCDSALYGYAGWRIEGSRNTFTSCVAQDNNEMGWRVLNHNGNSFLNCIADSNGKNYAGAGSGFSLENADNNTITGGQFFDRGANAFAQDYGIVIAGSSTNNLVVGDMEYNNASGAYNDTSTGTNRHIV
jgi:hypothetical protein